MSGTTRAWPSRGRRARRPAHRDHRPRRGGAGATLGPGHPTTGACLSNLATTHWALGRRVEALAMAERGVAVLEATLGPDHPDTVLRLRNVSLYRRLLDEEPA